MSDERKVEEQIVPLMEEMIDVLRKHIQNENWERARYFAIYIAQGCALKASEEKLRKSVK